MQGSRLADEMVISGMVLTLRDDEPVAVLDLLEADPHFTVGPRRARRMALVSEDPDVRAAERTVEWLQACPGVAHCDLVYARFDAPDYGSSEEGQR